MGFVVNKPTTNCMDFLYNFRFVEQIDISRWFGTSWNHFNEMSRCC